MESAIAASPDVLGSIDWDVVEFPGGRFNGEVAPATLDLESEAAANPEEGN